MKYGIVIITTLMIFSGCDQPTVENKEKNTTAQAVKQTYIPPPPKKKIELKEVEDTNFDAAYMYPEDTKKKEKVVKVETVEQKAVATADAMDKQECIAMISQEKFDKYTAMFGSETASIKRCKMIKATR